MKLLTQHSAFYISVTFHWHILSVGLQKKTHSLNPFNSSTFILDRSISSKLYSVVRQHGSTWCRDWSFPTHYSIHYSIHSLKAFNSHWTIMEGKKPQSGLNLKQTCLIFHIELLWKPKCQWGLDEAPQLLGKIQHLELAAPDSYIKPATLPSSFSQTVLPHPAPLQQPAPRWRCIHGRFPRRGPSGRSGCCWWDR